MMDTITEAAVFIYGPPGSGKSTLAPLLAKSLAYSKVDLDELIEIESGMSIAEIFALEGEEGFRKRERETLAKIIGYRHQVVALGGGTLLNPAVRQKVEESGKVLCLTADFYDLSTRLQSTYVSRPLLTEEDHDPVRLLGNLLESRMDHYKSFQLQLNTSRFNQDQFVGEAQRALGMFRISTQDRFYDVRVQPHSMKCIGEYLLQRGIDGPFAIITDQHVATHYLDLVESSIRSLAMSVEAIILPPGEKVKTVNTVFSLWNEFVKLKLDRGSTVIALGGGVIGDLAGFAAATYMRGIRWVGIPTTLLAMVDASLGGKTGADLPGGKNLVGSFHAPSLVLADPSTLHTLPLEELRSGMAEVVKHGIIADPELFSICGQGWERVSDSLEMIVKRAMKVKIDIIEEDPFEKGRRAVLNLGHTFGHALEAGSGYKIRHGEAVAIGMVMAARLSVKLGLASRNLLDSIQNSLISLGLPVEYEGQVEWEVIKQLIGMDKKRAGGKPKFVLPLRIGEVGWGYEIESLELLEDLTGEKI